MRAAETPVHGLWVWKSPAILGAPDGPENLLKFCRSAGINEVYLSVSAKSEAANEGRMARLIALLHRSNIRVEALLSSEDADQPGKHREKMLEHVQSIVQFNRRHPSGRFDGVHLDIEPQQRPENKGPGNLRFLPGLVEAFREVAGAAQRNGLTVNADIQNKLLKGDLGQRNSLLTSLSRLTLMLYEVSSPNDGQSLEQQAAKLQAAAEKYVEKAYEGLQQQHLAKMSIGLRTPDYAGRLPDMLKMLDASFQTNPHYLGWARHSYNDYLQASN